MQRLRLWQWRATYRFHSRAVRGSFGRPARVLQEGSWPPVPETEEDAGQRMAETVLSLAARHPGQRVRD